MLMSEVIMFYCISLLSQENICSPAFVRCEQKYNNEPRRLKQVLWLLDVSHCSDRLSEFGCAHSIPTNFRSWPDADSAT